MVVVFGQRQTREQIRDRYYQKLRADAPRLTAYKRHRCKVVAGQYRRRIAKLDAEGLQKLRNKRHDYYLRFIKQNNQSAHM